MRGYIVINNVKYFISNVDLLILRYALIKVDLDFIKENFSFGGGNINFDTCYQRLHTLLFDIAD